MVRTLLRQLLSRVASAAPATPAAVSEERPAKALLSRPAFPDGHFYSPVVDPAEATRDRARIWPAVPITPGLDFNDDEHRQLLSGPFRELLRDFDYPQELPAGAPPWHFHVGNSQFSWLDARALFVMLRHFRPRRMIEVGSGFSSLLAADVNRRFLEGTLDLTCIEPYPRQFLVDGVAGIARLVQSRAQEVDPATFEALASGDVLFIDSSHVSKTGSDVNHLVLQVLPRLRPGVIVHFHDIFLPRDYPEDWVLGERRSWNEQYMLHALLLQPSAFQVVFGSSYAQYRFPELVRACLGGDLYGGGSIWLRRVAVR